MSLEDNKEEPQDEMVGDLEGGFAPTRSRRVKAVSDVTAMVVEAKRGKRGANRRTVSDMVLFMSLPEEEHRTKKERTRQKSSTDVMTKFGYAPALKYDDLRLAEQVQARGTVKERRELGITDEAFEKEVEEDEEEIPEFPLNHNGLTSDEAALLLDKHGRNELPEQVDPKWLIFLRQFWAPMPIMIWIAIIIEIGIQNYIDMGILLIIQFTNASISFYETTKAGDAIAALKSSLKPLATVKRDGKFQVLDAALLVPGDTVLLASGSAIPADCRVNHGEIDVDQAALTGESLPVTFYKGDSCKMGSTVVRGEVEGTVEFTGSNTFFGKTASLLQETHEYSHLQKILMTVSIFEKTMLFLLLSAFTVNLIASLVSFQKSDHVCFGWPIPHVVYHQLYLLAHQRRKGEGSSFFYDRLAGRFYSSRH